MMIKHIHDIGSVVSIPSQETNSPMIAPLETW